jgi:hypothetical protein
MNQRRTKVFSLLQYLHKGNQTYAELELDPLLNFEHPSKATIEPFELESDNETAEVEIDLQLSMQEKPARGNEFQNKFQITNDER